jgi:hypothetical protein
MPQHNSSGGFAVVQKKHGLTIRQEQIRKVEYDGFTFWQGVYCFTEFADVPRVEPAADGQRRENAFDGALYPKHGHGCIECNFRSNRVTNFSRVLYESGFC